MEQLALSQQGLATTAQAASLRLHDRYLARSPAWTKVRNGVYRLSALPVDWRQDLMAAVLVGGPGAFASHRAAALLHGLDGVEGESVEITIPAGANNHNLPGVVVHRGPPIEPVDRTRRDHIPVTSVTRTLIDLGAVVRAEAVESALECALRHKWTSIGLLQRRLEVVGGPGRPGTAALRHVLADRLYEPPTGSELETRFLQLCDRFELPVPVRQYEVRYRGMVVALCDFAFIDVHLLVELDGYATHSSRTDHQSDLTRQNTIQLALPGWTLLRYTWEDVFRNPSRVVTELRGVLGRRASVG